VYRSDEQASSDKGQVNIAVLKLLARMFAVAVLLLELPVLASSAGAHSGDD
jgi:hypothetical protein